MFLSVNESEGSRAWYDIGLRLLFASTVPSLPDTTDVLSDPDYAGAKAAFDIVIARRTQWAEAYYYRGLAFAGLAQGVWEQPETSKALADFNKALSLDPRFVDAYLKRSDLYAKAHPRLAIADLSQVLALEPHVGAYLKRSELLQVMGENAAAVADYRAALQRYIAYCGTAERQQMEIYSARLTLELQGGNLMPVLHSLRTWWQQHQFTSFR